MAQVDLASSLGNTQTFVSKCERGERRIDAVELVEFGEALGIATQNLLAEYLDPRGGKSSAKACNARSRTGTEHSCSNRVRAHP